MAPRPVLVVVACVVTILVTPMVAIAQLVVHDATNDFILVQAGLEVARSIELVNLALRDLAPLGDISEAIAVAADLQLVLTETQTIASQMLGRRSLWGQTGPLPTTTRAFAEMRRGHTALCHLTATQGLQAQSLVAQVPVLLNRLSRLLQGASRILGSVAGLQSANAVMGELSGQLSILTSAAVAANEPQLCDLWAKRLQEQALESITSHLISDYAVVPGP